MWAKRREGDSVPICLLLSPIGQDVRMEPEGREEGAALAEQAWKTLLVEETTSPHTHTVGQGKYSEPPGI